MGDSTEEKSLVKAGEISSSASSMTCKTNGTHASKGQRVKDFSLNYEKTILKQLQAAKRDTCVEYTETGGGIKGTAEAVSFELIKEALQHFYDNYPTENGTIHIDRDTQTNETELSL